MCMCMCVREWLLPSRTPQWTLPVGLSTTWGHPPSTHSWLTPLHPRHVTPPLLSWVTSKMFSPGAPPGPLLALTPFSEKAASRLGNTLNITSPSSVHAMSLPSTWRYEDVWKHMCGVLTITPSTQKMLSYLELCFLFSVTSPPTPLHQVDPLINFNFNPPLGFGNRLISSNPSFLRESLYTALNGES